MRHFFETFCQSLVFCLCQLCAAKSRPHIKHQVCSKWLWLCYILWRKKTTVMHCFIWFQRNVNISVANNLFNIVFFANNFHFLLLFSHSCLWRKWCQTSWEQKGQHYLKQTSHCQKAENLWHMSRAGSHTGHLSTGQMKKKKVPAVFCKIKNCICKWN